MDKELQEEQRWRKCFESIVIENIYVVFFDFQWKDTIQPLFHHYDTKRVVLQTSVGAPPKERLEELKKMDAK